MGGGTMFRGVARLAGAAAIGAATVPSVGAHCHVRQPALRQPENLSAMSNPCQQDFCDTDTSHKDLQSLADLRFDEKDRDYCVAEEREEASDIAMRQLVFSPPPTEEEVEEATRELQTVLQLSIPAPSAVADENSLGSREDDIDMSPKAFELRPRASSLPLSQSCNHLQALAAESSSVMKAFQLLQTNPKVQDVVKSLACDPAVWNAVLSNEKVQELTQEDPNEFFSDDDENVSSEDESDDTFESSMWDESLLAEKLYSLVSTTKDYYSYVKVKLFSIMDSMFGTVEKKIMSKESKSTKDKTVASCIMLAVAVLTVVVMRRTMTRYPRP